MVYEKQIWANGDAITAPKLNNIEGGIKGMNNSYEKQTWVTGEVITAEKLNHIEDGIANGGSGGSTYAPSDTGVTLRDYDGTVLGYYTNEEFDALTELPNPPAPQGLVATGWTGTLEEAKASLAQNGVATLGRIYETVSGATEIDIVLPEERKSPTLGLGLNGTATIDWGDSSAEETITGTSIATLTNTQHQYASGGDYIIKITVTSGEMHLIGDSYSCGVLYNSDNQFSQIYSNSIKAVRIGNNVTGIGEYAFYKCCNLITIAIPNGVTNIGSSAFTNCTALTSVVIPNGVINIGSYAFSTCTVLTSIVIPKGVTTIEENTLSNCTALTSVVIPDGVISIGSYAFQCCRNLTFIVIPDGVTSMGDSVFASCEALTSVVIPDSVINIGSYTFQYCYNLTSITIPNGVTSIGDSMFASCFSIPSIAIPNSVTSISGYVFSYSNNLVSLKFKSTTPPTADRQSFKSLSRDCVIKVPTGSLSAYTSASNYPDSSTYTYVEY